MKKNLVTLSLLVILSLSLGGCSLTREKKEPTPRPIEKDKEVESKKTPPPIAVIKTEEPKATKEPVPEKTAEEQITDFFAKEYDKNESEVNITISKNTGTHASGGIGFEGEMGGAMWLAYNDGSGWDVVYDGNGAIPCSAVEGKGFPIDMVSECWDEATGTLKKF